MRERILIGTLMAVTALALVGVPAAFADEPIDTGGASLVDRADALDPAEESRVEAAIDALQQERGTPLVIVVVDSFTGYDKVDWATETAIASALPDSDVVFAIAVDDRQTSWSVGQDFPLSDDTLNGIVTDHAEQPLAAGDVAGAAIGFATGLSDAQAPSPVPWVLGGIAVVGVGTAITVPLVRRRRAATKADREQRAATADLEKRAGTALVQLDDALKTSEQELGFAQAQFGEQATTDFVTALASAKQVASQAFALRQKLDDAEPETPTQRTTMTEQLLALAAQADELLDAQSERFDQLRQLEKNAPAVLEQVATTRAGLAERIAAAEATLQTLPTRFAGADLTSIDDAPAQARKLDVFAAAAVDKARAAIASGPEGATVLAVRAAQQAVGQVEQLLAAVDAREAELTAQQERNAAASRELEHEIADARSQIAATEDYIATHRGGIASTARTRLSEAQRHLTQASELAASDAAAATAEAKQAETMAAGALSLARNDVLQYERSQAPAAGSYGESADRDRYIDRYDDGRDGAGLGGLLGDLFLGGGSGRSSWDDDDSSGGSWWGGGSGGSSGGSGWSWGGGGGSFGGSRRSSSSGSRRSSSGGGRRSSGGGGGRRR